jgi:hypothetical protein
MDLGSEVARFNIYYGGLMEGDCFTALIGCLPPRYGVVLPGDYRAGTISARVFASDLPSEGREQTLDIGFVVETVPSEEFEAARSVGFVVADGEPFQPWVRGWQEGPLDIDDSTSAWLKSRPVNVKQAMNEFPLWSLVTGTRTLFCPHPGSIGIVAGYREQKDGGVDLIVRQRPGPRSMEAVCRAAELRLVACQWNLTRERLKELIGEVQ